MNRAVVFGLMLLALAGCHVNESSSTTVIDEQGAGVHTRIVIRNPAIRASLGGSINTAAYMTIRNEGNQPDHLLSASCDCAAKVTLHTTMTNDGMMMMQEMTDGFALAPGQTVVFKPGGNHVMLEGLKQPLKDGGVQSVKLVFAKAGTVSVAMPVFTSPSDPGK